MWHNVGIVHVTRSRLTLLFPTWCLESCIPQRTLQNDCSIFTGILSVYGNDLAATTSMQAFLKTLLYEFPTFGLEGKSIDGNLSRSSASSDISERLKKDGVNRLDVSTQYSHIVRSSDNETKGGSDMTRMSIGAKMGLLLFILLIVVGIVVIVRYIRIQQILIQQQQNYFSPSLQYKYNKQQMVERKSSILSRFWNFYDHSYFRNSCDATQTSLSTVGRSSTNGGINNGNNSHPHNCPVGPWKMSYSSRQRQYPMRSIQYIGDEPDSIYIVEPDDETDSCKSIDPNVCSLSGCTEDESYNTSTDPLCTISTYHDLNTRNTPIFGYEVH
jgi:hypothetical protein